MKVDHLYTPCLLLDRKKLNQNISRMRSHLHDLGVQLRPHVKTAKSVPVALMCANGETGPITVSTLKEAEYFADAGFTDIIYAVSMVPSKLPRALAIINNGIDLKLLIDNADIAKEISAYGEKENCIFKVLIEIDSDMHRAGLSPDSDEVINVARALHDGKGTIMAGVLTHAGESYYGTSEDDFIKMAEQERRAITTAAEAIRKDGIPCPIVSCGSTPTATFGKDLTGITEVRAGVFVFQDAYQAGIGVCKKNDIALSVLTTVISHKKNQNRLITDAGGMALSKDYSTRGTSFDCGYGLVADSKGNIIDNLIVSGANQEHGLITTKNGDLDFEKYPIGTRLRILPNHACMTAAAYDVYNVMDNDDDISDQWQRCNGW
ncbi:MAG: alanine racemase [Alphaproteobacteria bacterium]|nr:alanine racemase [Alphaproteobacteria bacterium]HPF45608.1 alanine racemase [Emcibacteraceae bacterium]HRW29029.1 alanine racemase [Emcibacteraceae bacterium]